MSNVSVTVIVPAYNAENTLAETLNSIKSQNNPYWHCIVVDDGSTDSTVDIADSFASSDARFRVISQNNAGTAGAYNTGVSNAETEYVAICSADDLLNCNWLESMQLAILANPNYDIFCSNGFYLNHESKKTSPVYTTKKWEKEKELSLIEVAHCCFFSVGAVYRKSLFGALSGYRLGVYGEDYDFWIRSMARGAKVLYVPKKLSQHRISSFQKTANRKKVWDSADEVIRYSLFDKEVNASYRAQIFIGQIFRLVQRRYFLFRESKFFIFMMRLKNWIYRG